MQSTSSLYNCHSKKRDVLTRLRKPYRFMTDILSCLCHRYQVTFDRLHPLVSFSDSTILLITLLVYSIPFSNDTASVVFVAVIQLLLSPCFKYTNNDFTILIPLSDVLF